MSSKFYDIEIEDPDVSRATRHQESPGASLPEPLRVKHASVSSSNRQQSLRHPLPETFPVENTSGDDPDSITSDPVQPESTMVKEGMAAKLSRRVARRPCAYLLSCLLISTGLSVMAMIVGDFSVSANSGGWQSRGTMIADRQTQLMIAQTFQEDLFKGDDAVWENLMNNVLPGWEDDDDDSEGRRSLTYAAAGMQSVNVFEPSIPRSPVDYLHPRSDRIILDHGAKGLPFHLSSQLRRQLQINLDDKGCDMTWYSETNLTQDVHLWPMWKTKSTSSSVFEPAVLRDICEAEATTQAYLEANDLCLGCETGCLPPYSIVMFARLMVDNGWSMSCSDLADAWVPFEAQMETELVSCVADIKATYDPASGSSTLPSTCPPYFSPTMVENDIDVRQGKSQYTSSIFATRLADVDTMYDAVDHFDTAESSPTVDGAYDTQYEDFVGLYLDESLSNDMALALGSAVVVAIAIIIHTRSPFITAIGLLQIILSFPLSFMVYKVFAGLEFFPFLNFIGIFVVFALGAGDIFVAIDKWRDARQVNPSGRTEDIAAKAFPDAAMAMFLTSFTTALAFFSTAICPVAPIKMFAIFCGLLISFDYMMNVLLVFPALCIYDRAIQAKGYQGVNCCMSCSCFGMFRHREPTVTTQKMNDNTVSDGEDDLEMTAKSHGSPDTDTSSTIRNTSQYLGKYDNIADLGLVRRALLTFYNLLHMARWPLFVACAAALAVSIYYASTLALPTSADVRLLGDESQFERNYMWRQHLLSTVLEKSSGSEAYMIWGVQPADTGDINNPDTWSQLVLDTTFDSSSNESQVFLHNFCEDLFAQDFASPVSDNFTCPLTRFVQWLEEQSQSATPLADYTQNCNNASSLPMDPASWDSCLIGWSQLEVEPSILSRNGKVTIVMVPFASRVRYDDYYDRLNDEWKLIENWVKTQNSNAPQGVNQGYFSSFDFWWYDTNGQMLSTAYSSAAMALGGAAAVIFFTSQSLVLTLYCTITLGYVLTSVTATLVAMGWTLGFVESICFAILIGVSVDFVIHFGHAYSMAAHGDADRGFRTRYALISMGPSILATALTTNLSAVIMFFTVITFFQKFAMILFLSVLQACIGSFFVFLTMADCIGPRNPTYFVDQLKRYWNRS